MLCGVDEVGVDGALLLAGGLGVEDDAVGRLQDDGMLGIGRLGGCEAGDKDNEAMVSGRVSWHMQSTKRGHSLPSSGLVLTTV